MSIFKEYIDCHNSLTKLEIEKVKQSQNISQIRNEEGDRHRIDLLSATKAFDSYEKLEKIEGKIKTECEKKSQLHRDISKFMKEKLGEALIVGDFEIYNREGKLSTRYIVFQLRKRPGTLAEMVLNEVEYLSVHLEGQATEI